MGNAARQHRAGGAPRPTRRCLGALAVLLACAPSEVREPADACAPAGRSHCLDAAIDVVAERPSVDDEAPADTDVVEELDVAPTGRRCERLNELRCDPDATVHHCVESDAGERRLVAAGNCVAAGFQACLPGVGERGLDACVNACGGRGEACALRFRLGDPVPGHGCARWTCAADRCSVVPDHCACRIAGDRCERHCECLSLRCGGDGQCSP